MAKLKPCPVCGAKPRLRWKYNRWNMKCFQIYCPFAPVNIRTFWLLSEEEAIKMWNGERKARCELSQHY